MASQDEECDIMTVDECIPFHDFADFLESLSNTSNSRSKEEKATRFLNTFRQKFLELHGTMESNAETNVIPEFYFSLRLCCTILAINIICAFVSRMTVFFPLFDFSTLLVTRQGLLIISNLQP